MATMLCYGSLYDRLHLTPVTQPVNDCEKHCLRLADKNESICPIFKHKTVWLLSSRLGLVSFTDPGFGFSILERACTLCGAAPLMFASLSFLRYDNESPQCTPLFRPLLFILFTYFPAKLTAFRFQ